MVRSSGETGSLGVGGGFCFCFIEIRRFDGVSFAKDRSGREGCLPSGSGGGEATSSGFLTSPDQSPEDDRKMFRTEVRFFCRSERPGVPCMAASMDGCGLESDAEGDLTGNVGDVGDAIKLRRRADGLEGTLDLIDIVRKKSLKPAKPF